MQPEPCAEATDGRETEDDLTHLRERNAFS